MKYPKMHCEHRKHDQTCREFRQQEQIQNRTMPQSNISRGNDVLAIDVAHVSQI